MTIEEKLNSIRETKEAIKTSIKNKGIEVLDTDPFSTYSSKIDEIKSQTTSAIEINNASYLFQSGARLEQMDTILSFLKDVNNVAYMYSGCSNLTRLDLSSIITKQLTNMNRFLYNCVNLKYLDIRGFDFTSVTSNSYPFGSASVGVPADCEIIVKDETAKTWVLSQRSDFTSVKTVAELEA